MVWFPANGSAHETEQPPMRSSSCAAFDASYALGSDLPGAQNEQEAPMTQDLALSAEEYGD